MGTLIRNIIAVTVSIVTAAIKARAFNKVIILAQHTAFAGRVKAYASLTELAEDFATTSQVYLTASQLLTPRRKPAVFYVGRKAAGDANWAAALNAMVDENNDWYGVLLADPDAADADITAVAAWVETNEKLFVAQTSMADVLDGADDTDIGSAIKLAAYDRTMVMFHDERVAQEQTITFTGSFDASDTIGVVVNGSAGTTVNYTDSHANTLSLIAAAIESEGGAAVESATVVGTDTIVVVSAIGHDADNAVTEADITLTIGGGSTVTSETEEDEAAALNKHAVAHLVGLQLSKAAGSSNWEGKALAGITPDEFTGAQVTALEAKRVFRYEHVADADVGMTFGGQVGSGKWIDTIHGADRMGAAIAERIFRAKMTNEKIPYNERGAAIIGSCMETEFEIASKAPYNFIEDDYEVQLPEIDTDQRATRALTGFVGTANVQGAVNTVGIEINVVE